MRFFGTDPSRKRFTSHGGTRPQWSIPQRLPHKRFGSITEAGWSCNPPGLICPPAAGTRTWSTPRFIILRSIPGPRSSFRMTEWSRANSSKVVQVHLLDHRSKNPIGLGLSYCRFQSPYKPQLVPVSALRGRLGVRSGPRAKCWLPSSTDTASALSRPFAREWGWASA
jgi:hypothetical protein